MQCLEAIANELYCARPSNLFSLSLFSILVPPITWRMVWWVTAVWRVYIRSVKSQEFEIPVVIHQNTCQPQVEIFRRSCRSGAFCSWSRKLGRYLAFLNVVAASYPCQTTRYMKLAKLGARPWKINSIQPGLKRCVSHVQSQPSASTKRTRTNHENLGSSSWSCEATTDGLFDKWWWFMPPVRWWIAASKIGGCRELLPGQCSQSTGIDVTRPWIGWRQRDQGQVASWLAHQRRSPTALTKSLIGLSQIFLFANFQDINPPLKHYQFNVYWVSTYP